MNAIAVPVTGLYAGVLALFMVALALRVIRNRVRAKVGLFDGGDEGLGRAMRVHGNFIEYVPMALILMALVEINGAPAWALHAWGGGIIVSRLFHAYGLTTSSSRSLGRTLGMVLVWAVIISLSLMAFRQFASVW